MRILIDGKSLQASQHRRDGQRLCTLLSNLRRRHRVDFSSNASITSDELGRYRVLIIATGLNYTGQEIKAIHRFVRQGGGLLLMTNHANRNPNDTRAHDAELAKAFGITIEPTFFSNRLSKVPTLLAGSALKTEHPIIAGASNEERVQAVVTNTCSSLRCEQGNPLIYLSREMVDQRTGEPPQPSQLFAHALDLSSQPGSSGNGRIVTVADSGFIGSRWTEVLGPGLVTWGDNLRFIRNAIRWAGGQMD